MLLLISCYDPLGNLITLTEKRYYAHIVDRHGGFTLEDIQNAVERPSRVTRESGDAQINLYYRRDTFEEAGRQEVLKVCVRFHSDTGSIVSAYLVRGFKKGEVVLWPQP